MENTDTGTITVLRAEKGSRLAEELLDFVKSFSWEEVKAHTVQLIGEWRFEDWEAPFAAIASGRIIGMATLMKTDYYPLPEIFPWASTVFVSEEYRGRGVCGKLIEAVNEYARELGFDRTYIPTEFVGLYEKYGYRCIGNIVNYGGGVDRLYVKLL